MLLALLSSSLAPGYPGLLRFLRALAPFSFGAYLAKCGATHKWLPEAVQRPLLLLQAPCCTGQVALGVRFPLLCGCPEVAVCCLAGIGVKVGAQHQGCHNLRIDAAAKAQVNVLGTWSFCCVKTVLGKVSVRKKFGVYFFWRSVYNFHQFSQCLFFSMPKNLCVKFVLCKGFSVGKVLCVKMPTRHDLCAQKHLCTKHWYVKTSFFV